jgi:hypothetical protein
MTDLSTNTPYTYKEWAYRQEIDVSDESHPDYLVYLKSWYDKRNLISSENKQTLKAEYIQLLKDLSFLFSKSEENRFLRDIDYTNEDEIIYAIPFFAKKLKEISKVLKNKRSAVKNAKTKYNMVGSNQGLETLLYDYVLRSFTKKEGNITQIPASELSNILPQLSAVKNNFYIEVEELHDPNIYHDSDPSLSINDYEDIENLVGEIPLEELTDSELTDVLASRFIPRLSDSILSKLFQKYLQEDGINSTTVTPSLIKASQKYLGETIYGLTAVRLSETNVPDQILSLSCKAGNNWFLWPSGNKVTNDYTFSNIFSAIELNNSSFVASSAYGGVDYTTSDLIFTEKNGAVEGAWLLGKSIYDANGDMVVTFGGGEKKEFLFPYCGFKLQTKGSSWGGFSLNEDDRNKFLLLENAQREDLIKTYYSTTFPNSAAVGIALNRTELVNNGAFAGINYLEGDTIFKRLSSTKSEALYAEFDDGNSEAAFLYKIQKTDFPVAKGVNYVYWPYMTYTEDQNIPITILNDAVLDTALKEVSVKSFIGSTAGFEFSDSDVIFKLNSRTSEPMEAAFLQSTTTDELDITADSMQVYDRVADRCSKYLYGPIQGALALKIKPLEKVSFIWTDIDTYADEVFKFVEHSEDCLYAKKSHNYYKDQDFVNPSSTNKELWKKCTCKSVNYSPVGHSGETIFDYNGMADMLFHDPDGLGEDFAINTWKDTRNLTVKTSPQFSFYHLDSGDTSVGWGHGYWRTGSGARMLLKTGKRYTYYRTSLRSDKTTSPYFIVKYPYKKIVGLCHPSKMDIVIVWDISRTQINVFEYAKNIVRALCKKMMNVSGGDAQVSIIVFGNDATLIGYLSKDYTAMNLFLSDVHIPTTYPDYVTDIKGALELAYYILTTVIPPDSGDNSTFDRLCRDLHGSIIDGGSAARSLNRPRADADKKIILFSDGFDSYSGSNVIDYAEHLKLLNIQIHAIDFGEWSVYNTLMESITYSEDTYFNLQKYLIYGDGDENSFVEYLSRKLNGCKPIIPRWMKAVRDVNGGWVETSEDSDMVLRAGDFLTYLHRDTISYSGEDSYSNFVINCINFTINIKLNGWDYFTNTFSLSAYGDEYGAKPFWGKSYTDVNTKNRFLKETDIFGGHIRFFEEYTPVSQPEVSDMVLNNENFLTYTRKNSFPLKWTQPLDFVVTEMVNRWKKLEFYTGTSNLQEFLKNGQIDRIAYGSNIDSDMILEGYSQFKPARYNYYAQKKFLYTQNLYYDERDANSFVTFITGKYINPIEPYKNLTNIHYPTVAVTQFPKNCVTEKELGSYLLPEKLGVSSYLGRGYTSTITDAQITLIDSISSERVFYDLEKYGNRNRGFTKNDQRVITEISDIDNRWVSSSYFENTRSGIIKNPQNIQKLVPYQTDYEIKGKNFFGITRQDDDLQLWFPINPAKWKDPNYKLTFRGELTAEVLLEKIKTFLTNKGILVQWKSDIFGNEFGVYKGPSVSSEDPNALTTEDLLALLTEYLETITI